MTAKRLLPAKIVRRKAVLLEGVVIRQARELGDYRARFTEVKFENLRLRETIKLLREIGARPPLPPRDTDRALREECAALSSQLRWAEKRATEAEVEMWKVKAAYGQNP